MISKSTTSHMRLQYPFFSLVLTSPSLKAAMKLLLNTAAKPEEYQNHISSCDFMHGKAKREQHDHLSAV